MVVSSRTPEGEPHYCRVCGDVVTVDPSEPLDDSVCPQCGSLLLAIRDGLGLHTLHWSDDTSKLGDSVQWLEIIMEMEEEFDLNIPEGEAQRIRTVADAIRLIRKHKDQRDQPE